MMEVDNVEFDEMAENLDDLVKEGLGAFAKYRETMVEYKAEYLKYLLPYEPKAILDFGCGSGLSTPYLVKYFPCAKIYGCDVSGNSINEAGKKHPDCSFSIIKNCEDLEQYRGTIDCVFISCVLHHIHPDEHEKWMRGIQNILERENYLVIFEMNMLNPLSRNFVKKTPVDRNAIMLKPSYCQKLIKKTFRDLSFVKIRYSYFFPWRNKFLVGLERCLAWFPLGAQYIVVAKK